MLIGREPLFRWLVLLLCASAPSHLDNAALVENALIRGRTMELLSDGVSATAPEDVFLTGVLSLLDVILQMPASALLTALDLPDDVKAALQQRTGPYADLLRLAEAAEQPGPDGVSDLCRHLGIAPGKFSAAHNAALIWARGQQPEDAEETMAQLPDAAEELSQTRQHEPSPPHNAVVPDSAEPKPAQPVAESTELVPDAAPPAAPEVQAQHDPRQAAGDDPPKDLPRALASYTRAAEQGHAKAQWKLAVMYAQGQGGADRDLETAAKWHLQSAAQGFAPSQAALGLMYASGRGVKKNAGKAIALLQLAALQGDVEAQYNLAVMHEQGPEGELNLAEALNWFSQAAEQGLPVAQEKLGVMYAVGQAVTQDLIEAYKWFFIACKANLATAKVNLARCQDLLDASQVAEAQARAGRWMQDHVAQPAKA